MLSDRLLTTVRVATIPARLAQGKTKRSNSPSSATASGSFSGNSLTQRFQLAGTSRVWAMRFATHPCAVSSFI